MTVPPSDPWSFGWDQLISSANGIIILAGIVVARVTFRRWQEEKAAQRQFEIAEHALRTMYEAQDVFKEMRSEGNGAEPWKDVFTSIQSRESFWREVQQRRVELKAYFGSELLRSFEAILESKDELLTAAVRFRASDVRFNEAAKRANQADIEKHENDLIKYQAILWGIGQDDPIVAKLSRAVAELERVLLPIIRRPIKIRN